MSWATENHFVLFAHGRDFDVDAFLATTPLAFDKIWRRGEIASACAGVEHRYETSGVEVCLGDGTTLPLREQEHVACAFLRGNREPLRALAAFAGADHRFLRLQHRFEIGSGVVGMTVGPPSCLMRALLETAFVPLYLTLIVPGTRRAPRPRREP
jgi:hypothetical protein